MDIIYKPLVEVLLLHEFYLTDSEQNSIFDISGQGDRINYLNSHFDESDRTIRNDLKAVPDGPTHSLLKNQHMRFVPTPSGFVIAVRVQTQTLSDGTIAYQPKIPISNSLNLNILLIKTNSYLESFSNSRMSRNIPFLNYFSNEDVLNQKTMPSLSNAIPAYDENYHYEMGELALKSGTIQQYTGDGTANPWISVKDSGFVNESDRILQSFRFNYSFVPTDLVTQAVFTLTDGNGSTVQTIKAQSNLPLQNVALDFSGSAPGTIASSTSVPLYKMQVEGNNGYSKQFSILFYSDAVQIKSCWAVVNIKPVVKTAAFNLIEPDGFLVSRILPGGTATLPPIFEIRIKSRLAYWRYNSNNDAITVTTNTGTTGYLSDQSGRLISINPRISTYTPTLFSTDGVNFDNLPNPKYECLVVQEGDRFYKDIWVGKTEMFTADPP
jgi:hypothetical protein